MQGFASSAGWRGNIGLLNTGAPAKAESLTQPALFPHSTHPAMPHCVLDKCLGAQTGGPTLLPYIPWSPGRGRDVPGRRRGLDNCALVEGSRWEVVFTSPEHYLLEASCSETYN